MKLLSKPLARRFILLASFFCFTFCFSAPLSAHILESSYPALYSTQSFTNTDRGTHPQTVTLSLNGRRGTISADLSALRGATIIRATLDPYISPQLALAQEQYDIRDSLGQPISLRAPRYLTFDVTQAVKQAVAADGHLQLEIIDKGQGFGRTISLDILSKTPSVQAIPSVTTLNSSFAEGEVMLNFSEIDPPYREPVWTVGEYETALARYAHGETPKDRYRVYRSVVPFTHPDVWLSAELIDEILPLSGWNAECWGNQAQAGTKTELPVPMLPIAENQLAQPGTGIYVHAVNHDNWQAAYYYVSYTRDGAENFDNIVVGQNATSAINERSGVGRTLLWRSTAVNGAWHYTPKIEMRLDYYVRWSHPPYWNRPSTPFNYRVGVPTGAEAVATPPLTVDLHAWNEHFDIWSSWPHYQDGALLLTANLNVYNAYSAFHEHLGTLQSWRTGTAQPYFEARLLSFMYDFLVPTHHVDQEQITLFGESMGGAGAHLWGMRSGHLFRQIIGRVGHHQPAKDVKWTWQFEQKGGYGPLAWQTLYSNPQLARFGYPTISADDRYSVWDYFDNADWLRRNPTVETPFISHSNATNDPAISWAQAWQVTKVMHETKRPMNYLWGQGYHSQPVEVIDLPLRLHQSLPAFTDFSLDQALGTTPENTSLSGQINRYARWNPATIQDTPAGWSVELYLDFSSPVESAVATVTPRKLQKFRVEPNTHYHWQLIPFSADTDLGVIDSPMSIITDPTSADDPTIWPNLSTRDVFAQEGARSGTAMSDELGLLSLPNVTISKTPYRLQVVAQEPVAQQADLEVAIMAESAEMMAGEPMSYTLHITNHGPLSATNLTINQTFSLPYQKISTNTPTCLAQNGTLQCQFTNLASGAEVEIATFVTLDNTATGQLLTSLSVTSSVQDDDLNNNHASITTTLLPYLPKTDLAILSVLDSPDPLASGDELRFVVSLAHQGGIGATTAKLLVPLLAGETLKSADVPCYKLQQSLACSWSRFPIGLKKTINFTVQTNRWAGGVLSRTATLESAEREDTPADNRYLIETVANFTPPEGASQLYLPLVVKP